MYGGSLWFGNLNAKSVLKKFAVGFHKAIKKSCSLPMRHSNHDVCDSLNMLTFDHYINWLMIRLAFRAMKFDNALLLNLKSFFLEKSVFIDNVRKIGRDYDIGDIFQNDIDAIKSRLFYVQRNEPRTGYL